MRITLPARKNVPETELYVKVLKRFDSDEWERGVLILIPGGPGGNHTLYSDIEEALLEYADLVIIDLRGCGYSQESEVGFCTLEHHISDIEVLRSILNIEKPIIHGCSYGAIVALGYALSYPDKLSGLVLSSGAVSGDFIKSAKQNLANRGTPEQIKMAELIWEGKFESPEQFSEYYKTMAPLYMYNLPNKQDQGLPTLKQNIPYNTELINFAFQGFLLDFDYRQDLHKVKIPTLIFSGKNDWITDIEQANILHSGITESTLISLNECGHFPWEDQRDLFISNFKKFLKNL